MLLDSDDIRGALVPAPGYSDKARAGFYETLAHLAALLARQGLVVLVPASSHLRAYRQAARRLAPRFLEVFVDVPLEECARRDTKGLYALARTGRVSNLPGAGAAYEPPLAPDVTARGGRDRRAVAAILARLPAPRGQSQNATGTARPFHLASNATPGIQPRRVPPSSSERQRSMRRRRRVGEISEP